MSQSDHGIDACGAARGNVAGDKEHGRQQHASRRQCQWIKYVHAVEQAVVLAGNQIERAAKQTAEYE